MVPDEDNKELLGQDGGSGTSGDDPDHDSDDFDEYINDDPVKISRVKISWLDRIKSWLCDMGRILNK